MYKESKDKMRKSTLVISTITILLMVTVTNTPMLNSYALDLGLISKDVNTGSIDTDSLFSCVGAAITCVNENENNNNVVTNSSAPPPPDGDRGTLAVSKQIVCAEIPSDSGLCGLALASDNYPEPGDFTFSITGNNPNPASFPGSSSETMVNIGAGDFIIFETFPGVDLTALANDLGGDVTLSIGIVETGPDCGLGEFRATGTMTAGGSQECTIFNELLIEEGLE